MAEQEQFFSPGHNRLLNIAVWAKYLAWLALIYSIVQAGLVIFQYQADLQRIYMWTSPASATLTLKELFEFDPLHFSIDVLLDIASALLRGVLFYVILKSVFLGLNMIVETDINYRENSRSGGNDERSA